jgi:DTW domain-containing protein YfiP
VCICAYLPKPPLELSTPVFILQVLSSEDCRYFRPVRLLSRPSQNRKELKRKSNSVALLRLCLSPSVLHVASACHPNRALLQSCSAYIAAAESGRAPLLLYPADNALTEAQVSDLVRAGQRFSLVVLDGTWSEAREMSRRGCFDSMQSLALDVGKYSGLYSSRRPKRPGFLSTIEAVSYALDLLEPCRMSAVLLRPMLFTCLQEEQFAVQRVGGVKHRPLNPGYRACLMDDVRAAAAVAEVEAANVPAAFLNQSADVQALPAGEHPSAIADDQRAQHAMR